ncbi:MAG: ketoacyl-ACP synthase III [Deltaproteobacteria bacterium]|nr:ketoacyl-ACP synthase III [Deltaproteobacteria bacterium]MBK8239113.1 ketoacyl-ACP synthase III [Deltaproteobacteria bacterium]MBP7285767.1 ketoacyl-ACP synthase III [Nannocystaceae bacterium]
MKLVGAAAAVPKTIVKPSFAYEKFPQFDVDRIVGNTGVLQKREAAPGTTATDLCIAAAGPLLERLGWARDSVDAVILVTMLPDHYLPASSHRAHEQLGLSPRCLVFDINLGCSGFTHGLLVLDGLIASGVVKRALLLCGEVVTGAFKPRAADLEHRSDLANALLIGDAGTAVALSNEGKQLKAARFGADGSGFQQIIVQGGGARCFIQPSLFERRQEEDEIRRPIDLTLKGPQILTFAMKQVPPLLDEVLAAAEWTRDEVDQFVFHQANKFMLNFLRTRMKVPAEKVPLSIEEFGNTSSASIPLTMVVRGGEHLDRPTKWVLLGFGVGLSWSGVALETDSIITVPLVEV